MEADRAESDGIRDSSCPFQLLVWWSFASNMQVDWLNRLLQ